MSYYDKYIKYKNKYLILQSNIKYLKLFSEDDFDTKSYTLNKNKYALLKESIFKNILENREDLLDTKNKNKYLILQSNILENKSNYQKQSGGGTNTLLPLLDKLNITDPIKFKDMVSFYSIIGHGTLNKKVFYVPDKTYIVFTSNATLIDKTISTKTFESDKETDINNFLYQIGDSKDLSKLWYENTFNKIKDKNFLKSFLYSDNNVNTLDPLTTITSIYEPGDIVQDLEISLYDKLNQNSAEIYGIWNIPISYEIKDQLDTINNPLIDSIKNIKILIDKYKSNIIKKIGDLEKTITSDQLRKLNNIKPYIINLYNVISLDKDNIMNNINNIDKIMKQIQSDEMTRDVSQDTDNSTQITGGLLSNLLFDIIGNFISEFKNLILTIPDIDRMSLRKFENNIKNTNKQLSGKAITINDVNDTLFKDNNTRLSTILSNFDLLKEKPYNMKEYKIILVKASRGNEPSVSKQIKTLQKSTSIDVRPQEDGFIYNKDYFNKIGLKIDDLDVPFGLIDIEKFNKIVDDFKKNMNKTITPPIIPNDDKGIIRRTTLKRQVGLNDISKTEDSKNEVKILEMLVAKRKKNEYNIKQNEQKKQDEYNKLLVNIPSNKQFMIGDMIELIDGRQGKIMRIEKDIKTQNYGFKIDIIPYQRIYMPDEIKTNRKYL